MIRVLKKRKSWLINKQSICAKCKLQLGEHLLDNQAASSSIHHQCHDFSTSDKIPIAKRDEKIFTDNFPFQELNSDELINKQQELRQAQNLINEQQNLINAQREAGIFNKKLKNVKLNINDVCNLISVSSEHFN